jgi:FlaG/FlaF family flagellin (archaellin)
MLDMSPRPTGRFPRVDPDVVRRRSREERAARPPITIVTIIGVIIILVLAGWIGSFVASLATR